MQNLPTSPPALPRTSPPGAETASHTTPRFVIGIILVVLGGPLFAFYGIGALVTAGALWWSAPSVGWADVARCLGWASAGIVMLVGGSWLVARRGTRTAP